MVEQSAVNRVHEFPRIYGNNAFTNIGNITKSARAKRIGIQYLY